MWVFEDIVNDVAESDVRSDTDALTNVAVRYLILFTPRSGSSWLGDLLNGRMGNPGEFINPHFLRDVASAVGSRTRKGIVLGLIAKQSIDGVFGIEATAGDVQVFGENEFLEQFYFTHYFFLWRRDILLQAISLFRAVETGRFHSVDGCKPPDPVYSGEKIAGWLRHVANLENDGFKFLEQRTINAKTIAYEDFMENPRGYVDAMLRAIGRSTLAVPVPNSEHVKLRDNWSEETCLRFTGEYPDLIERIQSERAIVKFKSDRLTPLTPPSSLSPNFP